MRTHLVAFALVASLVSPASAAAPPINVLFAGTVARQYVPSGTAAICIFDGVQSTFLRTSGATKLVSLPDITIAPNGNAHPLNYTVGGQAQLTFGVDSQTAGRIAFAHVDGYPNGVKNPRFKAYRQNYDTVTRTLTVSFTIQFAGLCEVPVSATYRN